MDLSQTKYPRIFELMEKEHVTAKQLSSATGISQSNFTEWKKGRSNPKLDALVQISEFFSVPVEYLTGAETDENAIDLKIQAEAKQLSENQKADVLKYIEFIKFKD
jgi:transcriptional regulator with XRE-family HTH domain